MRVNADRIQIVKNLRSQAILLEGRNFFDIPVTMRDAADLITEQAIEIDKLTKSLKKAKK